VNIPKFLQHNIQLRKYEEKQILDTGQHDSTTLNKFINKDNSLLIFKSSETKKVEIVKAKISDPNLILINSIRIGMSKRDFFDLFFNKVESIPIQDIKTIKFISGLDGIWNNYYFKNDKLEYYTFDTDYRFNNY
jgi:ABC-type branched-subunit amino acid transport system ATPase component